MAKEVTGIIKLQIRGGVANPAPPVGPALGAKGVNIMEFCKAFNAETQNIEPGMPIPCVITAYQNATFSYITKTPPASYFLKKAAKLDKASGEAGRELVGRVTMNQVREIAEKKMVDLNTTDIDAACRMIAGSARSMGIEVQE